MTDPCPSRECALNDHRGDDHLRAAVDRLVTQWERRYVEFLNALLACPCADPDYWRWNGHAAQLRDVMTETHEAFGITPVPNYGSKEWRTANGVSRP